MQLATERERIQKQVQHSCIIISLIFFLLSALKIELTTFGEGVFAFPMDIELFHYVLSVTEKGC